MSASQAARTVPLVPSFLTEGGNRGGSRLPQTLLVLVGLIGSGKSTLADCLEQELGWLRCNQDDLQGDRRLVEKKVRAGLAQGRNVVVDRTNFDPPQRAHFLNIASNFPKCQKWALFLDVPMNTCRERLRLRTNHPTIKTFEEADRVLTRFSSQLRPPTASEGFDRVLHLKDLVPLVLPPAELSAILERVDKEGERQTLWSQSTWGSPGGGNVLGGQGAGNRLGGQAGQRGGWGGQRDGPTQGGQGGGGGGWRGGGQGNWRS